MANDLTEFKNRFHTRSSKDELRHRLGEILTLPQNDFDIICIEESNKNFTATVKCNIVDSTSFTSKIPTVLSA